jgi:hypothetical protein
MFRFPTALAALLVVAFLFPAPATPAGERIWLDDIGQWQVELFMGREGSGAFLQGPRLEAGAPGPMVFDADGNAYVNGGTFVFQVSKVGRVMVLAGLPGSPCAADGPASAAGFRGIGGMAWDDKAKCLYASDPGSAAIRKVFPKEDGSWQVETFAGKLGEHGSKDGQRSEARFRGPRALALDGQGTLYVIDGDRIRQVSGDEVKTLSPGGKGHDDGPVGKATFNPAADLTCDPEGNLYIADHWNDVLRKYDPKSGEVSTVVGIGRFRPGFDNGGPRDGPAGQARFHTGGGLGRCIFDPVAGGIWLCGADETAIRLFKDGQVRTLGPGTTNGPATGPAASAGAKWVALLGVDRGGRVYITDPPHLGLVRRIHKPGATAPAKSEVTKEAKP